MKQLCISFLILCSIITCAQPANEPDRFIEVTGDGEVKVDPNIIYLSIELREHKESGKIVKIEELEARLVKILQDVGIPKDNLKVFGSSGRQNAYLTKSALVISKRYNLKLTEVDLLNPVLAQLADAKILSVRVSEVTHTEIDKFKEEAKTKAVSDAKHKAALLTGSLDTRLGAVVQIRETELKDSYPVWAYGQARMAYQAYDYDPYSFPKMDSNDVDFEQIRLTYKIVVKFEIL